MGNRTSLQMRLMSALLVVLLSVMSLCFPLPLQKLQGGVKKKWVGKFLQIKCRSQFDNFAREILMPISKTPQSPNEFFDFGPPPTPVPRNLLGGGGGCFGYCGHPHTHDSSLHSPGLRLKGLHSNDQVGGASKQQRPGGQPLRARSDVQWTSAGASLGPTVTARWLHNPCRLGVPTASERGAESQVAHKWAR